jgi:hypothetical protein
MHKGDDLTTFTTPKVKKNPEALTFRIPEGLLRPVAGKLYLYVYLVQFSRFGVYKHNSVNIVRCVDFQYSSLQKGMLHSVVSISPVCLLPVLMNVTVYYS